MPSSVQTAAIALLVVAALATLLSYTSVVDVRSTAAADFGADLLVESRRRTSGLLEAQWNARKLAHTAQIVATSRDAVAPSATGGATPPAAAAAAAAAAPAPTSTATTPAGGPATAAAIAAGCGPERRPYHVILTSSSGTYQAWQCRMMYHHYQLQRSRDPCGEMGGLTRLLTSHNGQPDAFADEIPTFVVEEKKSSMGYVVVNRPHSMVQFVEHPRFREVVKEDYVYIAETDHLMLRPLPNLATPTTPAGFNFGYMVAAGQANIVNKFVPGLGGKTDPVGPSPVIIHVDQLKKVARPWHDFTLKIMGDREAVQALGWVREMWGYCIGAASLGIKHRVLDGFQFEGGSIGNRERRLEWPTPASPVGPERGYYLFHYTYGVEYSREGLPMELQVGEWSLDKRHYMGGPPPRALAPPPKCAHDRAFVLRGLYNNASATLPWKGGGGAGLDTFSRVQMRDEWKTEDSLTQQLLGTGPWTLSSTPGARGEALRVDRVWFLNNGWMHTRKGHGRWAADAANGGRIKVKVCGRETSMRLSTSGGQWKLAPYNEAEGGIAGVLEADKKAIAAWDRPVSVGGGGNGAEGLAERIVGSGPYRGKGLSGEAYFLRAGVLQVPGGAFSKYTWWHAMDEKRVRWATTEEAARDGGGDSLVVPFSDCFVIRMPKRGVLSAVMGGGSGDGELPALYGDGVEAASAEWILRPAATQCADVCAGLTLRRLTPADKAASPLARAVEGCCGWSWAGFGGLKFLAGGQLVSPWGGGVWGAPPEAQGAGQPALLAEFAGSKHLLRARVGAGGAVTSMESRRCADNDPAHVQLTDGVAKIGA